MSLKLLRMIMASMPERATGCYVSEARQILHQGRNAQAILRSFAFIQQNAVSIQQDRNAQENIQL